MRTSYILLSIGIPTGLCADACLTDDPFAGTLKDHDIFDVVMDCVFSESGVAELSGCSKVAPDSHLAAGVALDTYLSGSPTNGCDGCFSQLFSSLHSVRTSLISACGTDSTSLTNSWSCAELLLTYREEFSTCYGNSKDIATGEVSAMCTDPAQFNLTQRYHLPYGFFVEAAIQEGTAPMPFPDLFAGAQAFRNLRLSDLEPIGWTYETAFRDMHCRSCFEVFGSIISDSAPSVSSTCSTDPWSNTCVSDPIIKSALHAFYRCSGWPLSTSSPGQTSSITLSKGPMNGAPIVRCAASLLLKFGLSTGLTSENFRNCMEKDPVYGSEIRGFSGSHCMYPAIESLFQSSPSPDLLVACGGILSSPFNLYNCLTIAEIYKTGTSPFLTKLSTCMGYSGAMASFGFGDMDPDSRYVCSSEEMEIASIRVTFTSFWTCVFDSSKCGNVYKYPIGCQLHYVDVLSRLRLFSGPPNHVDLASECMSNPSEFGCLNLSTFGNFQALSSQSFSYAKNLCVATRDSWTLLNSGWNSSGEFFLWVLGCIMGEVGFANCPGGDRVVSSLQASLSGFPTTNSVCATCYQELIDGLILRQREYPAIDIAGHCYDAATGQMTPFSDSCYGPVLQFHVERFSYCHGFEPLTTSTTTTTTTRTTTITTTSEATTTTTTTTTTTPAASTTTTSEPSSTTTAKASTTTTTEPSSTTTELLTTKTTTASLPTTLIVIPTTTLPSTIATTINQKPEYQTIAITVIPTDAGMDPAIATSTSAEYSTTKNCERQPKLRLLVLVLMTALVAL
jgi:hypothetical protein